MALPTIISPPGRYSITKYRYSVSCIGHHHEGNSLVAALRTAAVYKVRATDKTLLDFKDRYACHQRHLSGH